MTTYIDFSGFCSSATSFLFQKTHLTTSSPSLLRILFVLRLKILQSVTIWRAPCPDILMIAFPAIICKKSGSVSLKEEDVAVSNVKIDLTRGRSNPLERYSILLWNVPYLEKEKKNIIANSWLHMTGCWSLTSLPALRLSTIRPWRSLSFMSVISSISFFEVLINYYYPSEFSCRFAMLHRWLNNSDLVWI